MYLRGTGRAHPVEVDKNERLRYHRGMPIDRCIQAWRRERKLSLVALAKEAGLSRESLEGLENGQVDPSVSMVEALASALAIPPAWLYNHPDDLKLLFSDLEEDECGFPNRQHLDPITERLLLGQHAHRELYVLLTALLQHGEPKLLRAAEVNLRSLLKQAKTATVPWQNRQPGHFEPPTD